MALKQVVDTTKSTYLTKRFEDDEGNRYEDIAAKSLVGWYRFKSSGPTNLSTNKFYDDDDPPGLIDVSPAYESSASTPTLSKEKFGEVLYDVATFDGVDDLVTIGTATKWDHIIGNQTAATGKDGGSTQKMTFAAWIHPTGNGDSAYPRIVDIGGEAAVYMVKATSGGDYSNRDKIGFFIRWSGGLADWRIPNAISNLDNNWHHVVVTYDPSSINNKPKFYINGKLVTDNPDVINPASGTYDGVNNDSNKACIGNQGPGGTFAGDRSFQGKMSEVCIWNQCLTSENIKAMYNVSQVRFTRNQAISGFLNHSPRIQSIENSNYHDVHGKFDDTKTIDFIEPRQEATIRFNRVPSDGLPSGHTISITDAGSSVEKVFEFQRGVILTFDDAASVVNAGGFIVGKKYKIVSTGGNSTDFTLIGSSNNTVGTVFTATGPGTGIGTARPENVEVNIRGIRTPSGAASRFAEAVNRETNNGSWTFQAEKTKQNEVVIRRGKIDSAAACTISTTAPERFIEVIGGFKVKPQPATVYPSLEIKGPHLDQRKNYGGSIRSDIELIRPVYRGEFLRPKVVHEASPFDESLAHNAFGFHEGVEGVSPERDLASNFYVSGSSIVTSPASIKSRKRVVIDMPVATDTTLKFDATSASGNHPMAYYNTGLQRWELIGMGTGSFDKDPTGTLEARIDDFREAMDHTMVGFSPSRGIDAWRVADRSGASPDESKGFEAGGDFRLVPTGSLAFQNGNTQFPRVLSVGSLASPTNTFGFPMHPKFHATGSQEIVMSNYIQRPFVLEKIVYEFNVGSPVAVTPNVMTDASAESQTVDLDTVTFFLLNQRSAALGNELNETPKIRIGNSNNQKGDLFEATNITNGIGSLPRKIQLTPSPLPNQNADTMIKGRQYKIISVNNTNNFTAMGADASPAANEIFTYNGTAANTPSGTQGVVREVVQETEVDTMRDLVTWSRLTSSPSNLGENILDSRAKDVRKESSLVVNPSAANRAFGAADGSPVKYSVSENCIAAVVQIASSSIQIGAPALGKVADSKVYFGMATNEFGLTTLSASPPASQHIMFARPDTGRTLAGIESGRSLFGENPAPKRMYTFRGAKLPDLKITAYESDNSASPYVLLPTDKLILGCQSPISADITGGTHSQIKLGQGEGRIILYGYEIQKETELIRDFNESSTGNSSFFSENIGTLAVRDQFETSPRMTYYRSSIDEVVTGSMQAEFTRGNSPQGQNVDNFTTSIQKKARQVIGRNSQGTQGERGSLLRARKLQDTSERYYDSMLPDVQLLARADNVRAVDITGLNTSGILLGVSGSSEAYRAYSTTIPANPGFKLIWDNWFASYPFEARYQPSTTTRLAGTKKNIIMPTQTGAGKATTTRATVDHISIAMFEGLGDLRVVGNVEGTYTSTGILDNPNETENTNRLVPGGRSSGIFINSPKINESEVFLAWSAESTVGSGSIELSSDVDSLIKLKALNGKTLTVPAYANLAASTVTESFIFSVQDKATEASYATGKTRASITPGKIRISYDDSRVISEFDNMLIQLPFTGSAEASSGFRLFLDSAGTNTTGDASTAASGLTRVNAGSVSALGTSTTTLNDMWVTGSVTQIGSVANAINIVDPADGSAIAGQVVSAGSPMIFFNDTGHNESQRFIHFDRLINSFDTGDVTFPATQDDADNFSDIVTIAQEVSLKFKHVRGVNTNVHSTFTDMPDSGEDIVISISSGDKASVRILGTGNGAVANILEEKDAIEITSTDGTTAKYVVVNSNTSSVSTGEVIRVGSDTGSGTADSSLDGAIAVSVNLTSSVSSNFVFLTALKSAITSAGSPHNGKITAKIVDSSGTEHASQRGDIPQYLLLTQAVAGLSGNTTVTHNLTGHSLTDTSNATVTGFTGGLCLGTERAVWGQKIHHAAPGDAGGSSTLGVSRSEGFITNEFRIGHSLKMKVNNFGRTSSHRSANKSEGYNADYDVIRFQIACGDPRVNKRYQFFPTHADAGSSVINSKGNTGAANNIRSLHSSDGVTVSNYLFSIGYNSGDSGTGATVDYGVDDLARARLLAEAITNAGRWDTTTDAETGDGPHMRFIAFASQEGSGINTDTFINIYFTSYAQKDAPIPTPALTQVQSGASSNTNTSRSGGSQIANNDILIGAGAADPFFVTIGQTSANFIDPYAFVDLEITGDLDPNRQFLKYDETEDDSAANQLASMVSVNTANKSSVDDIYAEIANAINVTASATSARPTHGIISAVHNPTANTLELTYNSPTKASYYSSIKNKILLPLPGARYDLLDFRPSTANETHRIISISREQTHWDANLNTAFKEVVTQIKAGLDAALVANNATGDNITWAPTITYPPVADGLHNAGTFITGKRYLVASVDGNVADTDEFPGFSGTASAGSSTFKATGAGVGTGTASLLGMIEFKQQGKGILGNEAIVSSASSSDLIITGFSGGESAIYGDGDTFTEPQDVDPESTSSFEITCNQANIVNGETLSFQIGNLSYSASIDSSTNSSTALKIGVQGIGSNEDLAQKLSDSLTAFFTTSDVTITIGTDANDHKVTVAAKNKLSILGPTPTLSGTSVADDTPAFTSTDWNGADLVKIIGAPLRRTTIQKGVKDNDPEDVDTVHFASILAKDQPSVIEIDEQDKIFELGSRVDSPTDFYAKVFFGTGIGPAKSPQFNMTEPSTLTVATTATTVDYVTHAAGSNKASVLGANLSTHASFEGVGTSASISDNGSASEFDRMQTSDKFIDFADAGTRRMNILREVQAGETVYIRFAACTFDSGVSGSPVGVTSQGSTIECAESSDDGVCVKVSLDGGGSFVDVATVFQCKMDNVSTTSSELFKSDSFTQFSTPRFQSAAQNDNSPLSGNNPVYHSDAAASDHRYPLFQFTATASCRIRLEQPVWSAQSISFDHFLFRYLQIAFAPSTTTSSPISPRGNFNQNAIATNVEIRGAKYGLISPLKLNTSAIFRAGSFGQCRDMLEQRKFTRTFDGQRVSETAVAVSFQARNTKRVISPEETNSSNLDSFCTSSLPYFDGLNVDRTSVQPDLVDEVDIDIQV